MYLNKVTEKEGDKKDRNSKLPTQHKHSLVLKTNVTFSFLASKTQLCLAPDTDFAVLLLKKFRDKHNLRN